MLIFKFTKTGPAALVSHVDNLRAVTYLMRRAGVAAQYSQGFNPHMELGFSAPIALGVESLAEYVSVKTAETANLLARLNAASPDGIRFVAQWNADVNLAAVFNRAKYKLEFDGVGEIIDEITAPNYSIDYLERGNWVTKDVSAKIFSAERLNIDSCVVTLATGNDNLRPDRLVNHLLRAHGRTCDYKIVKLQAFANDLPADEYLSNACRQQMGR